jgi:hypothetical protein
LFEDLSEYPNSALTQDPSFRFKDRWELALSVLQPPTVLHHWAEQLVVRSTSDSLIEKLRVCFAGRHQNQNWTVECAIEGVGRFASMDELREYAKQALEAAGWTELNFRRARRSGAGQAEILFRGTRPSGSHRFYYVVRP